MDSEREIYVVDHPAECVVRNARHSTIEDLAILDFLTVT